MEMQGYKSTGNLFPCTLPEQPQEEQ